MIDLGVTKLALIGVVALVVIGPERLPRVARMAGSLFGRAQRYINDVKSEVSREIELEELHKMQKEMRETASGIEQSIAKDMSASRFDLHSAESGSAGFDPASADAPSRRARERQSSEKVKSFRKRKMLRTSAIPSWYKKQNAHKSRVVSAAARVAMHRPAKGGKPSSFFS